MKLLVCLAGAALSGCVSVQPHPAAPPRPGVSRPAHDLAPQTAGPPVHDTLEAVPEAKPSRAASPSAAHKPSAGRGSAGRPAARPAEPRLSLPRRPAPAPVVPLPRRIAPAPPAPAPALPAPGGGTGVCALGRGYGHWPAGSPQSRICDRAYGR